jgi:hypothetical protein
LNNENQDNFLEGKFLDFLIIDFEYWILDHNFADGVDIRRAHFYKEGNFDDFFAWFIQSDIQYFEE